MYGCVGLQTQFGAGLCHSRSAAGQAQPASSLVKTLTTSAGPISQRHGTPLARRATRACAFTTDRCCQRAVQHQLQRRALLALANKHTGDPECALVRARRTVLAVQSPIGSCKRAWRAH